MPRKNFALLACSAVLILVQLAGAAGADWRAETFALEPARIDHLVFAKPKGWTVHPISGLYMIIRPDLKATISLSIGDPPGQEGRPVDLDAAIESAIKLANPTRVLSPATKIRCDYREAIIERQGKSGPNFVAVNVSLAPTGSGVLTGLLATQNEGELSKIGGQRLLNAIVHSVSKAAAPFPPAALVGRWEDVIGQGYTKVRQGDIIGSAVSGFVNTYQFGKDGQYQRRQESFSSGQIISGLSVRQESGTYATDGSTIVFQPQRCTSEWYQPNGVRTMNGPCGGGDFPRTAFIRKASAGKELWLSGQGLSRSRAMDCDNVGVDFTAIGPDR